MVTNLTIVALMGKAEDHTEEVIRVAGGIVLIMVVEVVLMIQMMGVIINTIATRDTVVDIAMAEATGAVVVVKELANRTEGMMLILINTIIQTTITKVSIMILI